MLIQEMNFDITEKIKTETIFFVTYNLFLRIINHLFPYQTIVRSDEIDVDVFGKEGRTVNVYHREREFV